MAILFENKRTHKGPSIRGLFCFGVSDRTCDPEMFAILFATLWTGGTPPLRELKRGARFSQQLITETLHVLASLEMYRLHKSKPDFRKAYRTSILLAISNAGMVAIAVCHA